MTGGGRGIMEMAGGNKGINGNVGGQERGYWKRQGEEGC